MPVRVVLKFLISLMCLVALLMIVSVLWQSAHTPEPPRDKLLQFDLSQLAPASFSLQDCPVCSPKAKVLLVWREGEEMWAFLLRTRDGAVIMPDAQKMWQGEFVCHDFAPQSSAPGRLKPNASIQCFDATSPEAGRWLWSLSGKAFNPDIPDLIRLNTERQGQFLVVYR